MPLPLNKDPPSTGTSTSAGNAAAAAANNRRQFALWASHRNPAAASSLRFQMPRGNVADILLDGCQTLMEGAVYILGPFLIALALAITALLSYTFFYVLVPMMMEKHASRGAWQMFLVVSLHSIVVIFLLVNILFNYAMCVLTRNDGPSYDKVVRELAAVTGFVFPETPAQTLEYRRDFEDRMVIRMRRRKAREEAEVQQQQQQREHQPQHLNSQGESSVNEEGGQTTVTQRRGGGATAVTATAISPDNAPDKKKAAVKNAIQTSSSTVVRRWMLMGPYEWGFCANSMQPKPPRSHYDHVTKKLVLNLDHYCPWVFNAVSYFNYRYFVNFLIYVFCGMCYGLVVTMEPFLWLQDSAYTTLRLRERAAGHHLTKPHPMIPRREEKMLVSLSFMLCLAVGIALIMLGGFHIYLTLTAQTTIEFHGNWAKRKRQGSKFKNPYDQGWRRNWKQIYGDQPWYIAILPSRREPEYLPVPIPAKNTRRKDIALEGLDALIDPGV